MNNPVTYGHIVYRVSGGNVEFMGLLQTKEKAEADIKILNRHGQNWLTAQVPFLGWGQVAPGVFSQNGPAPLKIVKDDEPNA
jgi:hypothetical protein